MSNQLQCDRLLTSTEFPFDRALSFQDKLGFCEFGMSDVQGRSLLTVALPDPCTSGGSTLLDNQSLEERELFNDQIRDLQSQLQHQSGELQDHQYIIAALEERARVRDLEMQIQTAELILLRSKQHEYDAAQRELTSYRAKLKSLLVDVTRCRGSAHGEIERNRSTIADLQMEVVYWSRCTAALLAITEQNEMLLAQLRGREHSSVSRSALLEEARLNITALDVQLREYRSQFDSNAISMDETSQREYLPIQEGSTT